MKKTTFNLKASEPCLNIGISSVGYGDFLVTLIFPHLAPAALTCCTFWLAGEIKSSSTSICDWLNSYFRSERDWRLNCVSDLVSCACFCQRAIFQLKPRFRKIIFKTITTFPYFTWESFSSALLCCTQFSVLKSEAQWWNWRLWR